MTIRSTDEGVAVEYPFYVREIDLVIAPVDFAFPRISVKSANLREQFLYVFRHSEAPPDGGYDT